MTEELISTKFLTSMKLLGVNDLEDLLLYLPSKYRDFRKTSIDITGLKESGKKEYIKLKLLRKPIIESAFKGPSRTKLQLTDGRITVTAMVFGNSVGWKNYKEGDYVFVIGSYGEYNNYPQIQGIELIPKNHQGKIIATYKGKEKIVSPTTIAEKISICICNYMDLSIKYIEKQLGLSEKDILMKIKSSYSSLSELFINIHKPRSFEEIEKANKNVRMINALQALLLSQNKEKQIPVPESIIDYDENLIKKQLINLPFQLTMDQKRAIWEISKDLKKVYPMDMLLSGDVGCGKTISYSIPAVCSFKSGKNVVIMMPNLLLANQVANEIKESFPDSDVTLVLGGKDRLKGKPQKRTIIVGTTAILWWLKSIGFDYEIDLLIIDEQQKLGVNQKNKLIGKNTNVIEATATAIPRTAAAVLYGNKKVSLIEECPVEKNIVTKIVDSTLKKKVFDKLLDITKSGAQIAVLYPIRKHENAQYQVFIPCNIEKSGKTNNDILNIIKDTGAEILSATQNTECELDNCDNSLLDKGDIINYRCKNSVNKKITATLKELEKYNLIMIGEINDEDEVEKCKRSVESAAKHWEKHFPDQVVMIHGGLNTKQKIEAVEQAKNGKCKVIVTSSVIEIGLTMPDLRGLLILEANNYGASTLHQFRGRLARKGGNGVFFMGVDCKYSELENESKARLNLLVKYNKGSLIAENDMKLRGFGDLSQKSDTQAGFVDGVFPRLKMRPQDIEELLKTN